MEPAQPEFLNSKAHLSFGPLGDGPVQEAHEAHQCPSISCPSSGSIQAQSPSFAAFQASKPACLEAHRLPASPPHLGPLSSADDQHSEPPHPNVTNAFPLPLVTDDSLKLILSPFISRSNPSSPPHVPPNDLFQTLQFSSPPSAPPGPTVLPPVSPIGSTNSDTIVEETQFSDTLPQEDLPVNTPPRRSPIKAIPIQALTPNGTICVLPGTPQLDSKKPRRRSSRLLNSEEGSNVAARIEKAAMAKSLELPSVKKNPAPSTVFGSIELPVLDFTDEELAMISTATGYRLPEDMIEAVSNSRASMLGSRSA